MLRKKIEKCSQDQSQQWKPKNIHSYLLVKLIIVAAAITAIKITATGIARIARNNLNSNEKKTKNLERSVDALLVS